MKIKIFTFSKFYSSCYPLFIIILLSIIVKMFYLYDSSDNPTFNAPIIDSATYHRLASEWKDSTTFTAEYFYQPFWYPFFLSVFYFLFGTTVLYVKIFQVFLGVGTCVLTYVNGAFIFNKRTGFLAGLIISLYGPLIFFEAELLSTGWAAFWAAWMIYIFTKAKHSNNLSIIFITGMSTVLSVLIRPTFILFSLSASVWLMLIWRKDKHQEINAFIKTIVFIYGILILAFPVSLSNLNTTGNFSILPNSGGMNLYIGNNPNAPETTRIRPGIDWKRLTEMPYTDNTMKAEKPSTYFYRKVLDYATQQPISFLKNMAHKTFRLLSWHEIPRNIDIYTFREWSSLLKTLVWHTPFWGFPFGLILPLAVTGAIFKYRRLPVPLKLFMFLYPISLVMVFISARYRIPLIPAFSILAAAGITTIIEYIKAGNVKKNAVILLLIILVYGVQSVSVQHQPPPANFKAELYCGVGEHFKAKGEKVHALINFSKAVGIKPDYEEAYFNMGNIYMAEKILDRAMDCYSIALEIRPDYDSAHTNYGLLLEMLGKNKAALEHYKMAIQINPRHRVARLNLGMMKMESNNIKEAIDVFVSGLEYLPEDPLLHYRLGLCFLIIGNKPSAEKEYRILERIEPDIASELFKMINKN